MSNQVVRIDSLDGLRGIAALWVLVGHVAMLSGFNIRVIGSPDLGVDLFIMLSGFLMVFQYSSRKTREPWGQPKTWFLFWCRRFFRIAPLYYFMLVIALSCGSWLYELRVFVDQHSGSALQLSTRYLDDSWANYIAHLTFIYGFIPEYSFRTPLPDWSIGLEMQYYAAFPFMMLILDRFGWVKGGAALTIASVVIALGVLKSGVEFPLPSFLFLKLHVFLAGMVLASALQGGRRQVWLSLVLALFLVSIPIGGVINLEHRVIRLALAMLFFCVIYASHLPSPAANALGRLNALLGSRFSHQLGELSYGVYLTHLMVITPVIAYLIRHDVVSPPKLWLLAVLVSLPLTYAISWVCHVLVEKPGISAGRHITSIQALRPVGS